MHRKPIVILVLGALILAACSSPPRTSDLGGLYNELAQHEDPYRNPIVLIPGILGSKLANRQTDQMAWGSANPKQDNILKMLLPDINSPQKRREIAIDHLKKYLRQAKQFVKALDLPAEPPDSIHYYLVAGDSENTDKTAQFHRNGNLTIAATAPGDSVVLRSSALMSERPRDNPHSRLVSPIKWTQVFFLFSDHRKITRYPEFTDNLLYIVLESP